MLPMPLLISFSIHCSPLLEDSVCLGQGHFLQHEKDFPHTDFAYVRRVSPTVWGLTQTNGEKNKKEVPMIVPVYSR